MHHYPHQIQTVKRFIGLGRESESETDRVSGNVREIAFPKLDIDDSDNDGEGDDGIQTIDSVKSKLFSTSL